MAASSSIWTPSQDIQTLELHPDSCIHQFQLLRTGRDDLDDTDSRMKASQIRSRDWDSYLRIAQLQGQATQISHTRSPPRPMLMAMNVYTDKQTCQGLSTILVRIHGWCIWQLDARSQQAYHVLDYEIWCWTSFETALNSGILRILLLRVNIARLSSL